MSSPGKRDLVKAFNPDRLNLFWSFVNERQRIWHRRFVERTPPPWTKDRILATTKFTNVYRELDPGTQYAITHILESDNPKADKLFNVMFYRLIGRSDTHHRAGFQSLETFDAKRLAAVMKCIRDDEGKAVFTAAYMVSGYTQMGSRDKVDNVVRLFQGIRDRFEDISRSVFQARSAEQAYQAIRAVNGFGNFLAYQTLVDCLYPLRRYAGRPLLPFSHDDWAQAGPGARAGIKMLLRPDQAASDLDVMRWLRANQNTEFDRLGINFPYLRSLDGKRTEISLANIQNCLCEYHKYVKIGDGTGRGRNKYEAAAGYQRSLESFGIGGYLAQSARRLR